MTDTTREARWGELIAKHALNWPRKDASSREIMHYLHSVIFDGWRDGFKECAAVDDAASAVPPSASVDDFDREFELRMKQTNQVPA